jgi:hypothetical protein
MKFKDEALQQVVNSLPGFKNGSDEFLALDQLNYLTFFLINAMNSFTLAKKYNDMPDISKEEQVNLASSLFRDGVMNYAKCFSSAEAKKLKIDFKAVVKDLQSADRSKYLIIHEEMINIRHKYVAHNLDNDFEFSVVATKIENNTLYLKPTFTVQIPIESFDKYFKQCGLIQNYIISKIHKTLTKIRSNTGITVEFG